MKYKKAPTNATRIRRIVRPSKAGCVDSADNSCRSDHSSGSCRTSLPSAPPPSSGASPTSCPSIPPWPGRSSCLPSLWTLWPSWPSWPLCSLCGDAGGAGSSVTAASVCFKSSDGGGGE
eukprot:scaffold69688_cov63-Phaeocystis_antarctica.AAC.1